MKKRAWLIVVIIVALHSPAWGQAVSGVRGMGGGAGALFNLVGPGNLYVDSQGTQGYMYNQGTFESYNFRNPTTGQAWMGGMTTLGPQLSVGLISGANQAFFSGSTGTTQLVTTPTVIPPPPPALPPLPPIGSSILEDIP